MMMMIESALAVGFRATNTNASCSSSSLVTSYQPWWISNDANGILFTSQCSSATKSKSKSKNLKSRIRASATSADPPRLSGKPSYHPFEEIGESTSQDHKDAKLTAAETTRTLIEVNSKATLMFSGLIDDLVHDNIFWPDVPYITDEHGNIHFEVKEDQDILQSLTSEDNFVQVMIGLNTTEMLSAMELGPSEIDFGIEEIGDEDIDGDDIEDWVAILGDEEDEVDSDDTVGDWAKLETMRSSHPLYFAKKMVEVTSDDPMDSMDQPSAGLAILGLLRPAFIQEHSVIRKYISEHQSSKDDSNQVGKIVEDNVEDLGINGLEHKSDFRASCKDGSIWAEGMEKGESLGTVTSFYKLEMIKIRLVSAHGSQIVVEEDDFQKARPDVIAHSAAKIISRLKAGGEKTSQALRSLCCRVKGIQVEEAKLIGVDCLGFDLRVCSGIQVQTLRFAFNKRATSEYSAERQLHDLMSPLIHHKPKKWQAVHQKES